MRVVTEAYDYVAAVTASDTVSDPAGPFAGLLVTKTGNLTIAPATGPLAGSTITITGAPVGMYIRFPVKRVNSTNLTAEVVGLVQSAVVSQGFA